MRRFFDFFASLLGLFLCLPDENDSHSHLGFFLDFFDRAAQPRQSSSTMMIFLLQAADGTDYTTSAGFCQEFFKIFPNFFRRLVWPGSAPDPPWYYITIFVACQEVGIKKYPLLRVFWQHMSRANRDRCLALSYLLAQSIKDFTHWIVSMFALAREFVIFLSTPIFSI